MKKEIYSAMDGIAIPIEEVPDEAFSKKMLGEGVAIIPNNGEVKSPVNGRISKVFRTKHAYSILGEDGIEILVHIGLDTVELKGEGFESAVEEGDSVKVGDLLCTVDLAMLNEREFYLHTPIVIVNTDKCSKIRLHSGNASAGKTAVISYEL